MILQHHCAGSYDRQSTALIGFAAAVIGGAASGFYQHVRDWWTGPRLSLNYADDAAHFVNVDFVRPGGQDVSAVYVRVGLNNSGKRVAKGCRVFLTKLEEVHESGTTEAPLHDSLLLGWPGGTDFSPRDLPKGVDYFADVVFVSKHAPGFRFAVREMYANQLTLGDYRGTYRFHLLLTAENADPVGCKIDVSYAGDWHNLRAISVR